MPDILLNVSHKTVRSVRSLEELNRSESIEATSSTPTAVALLEHASRDKGVARHAPPWGWGDAFYDAGIVESGCPF